MKMIEIPNKNLLIREYYREVISTYNGKVLKSYLRIDPKYNTKAESFGKVFSFIFDESTPAVKEITEGSVDVLLEKLYDYMQSTTDIFVQQKQFLEDFSQNPIEEIEVSRLVNGKEIKVKVKRTKVDPTIKQINKVAEENPLHVIFDYIVKGLIKLDIIATQDDINLIEV